MNQDQGSPSSVEASEPENVSDVSPGEQLKNARLALGLSINDVSSQLKLTVGKIELLEHGDIADIAAPVFVAGYLRAYARLLGLSEDDVLADFEVLSAMQSSSGDVDSEEAALENGALNPDGMIATPLPSQSTEAMFNRPKSFLTPVLMGLLVIVVVYFTLPESETPDDVKTVSAVSKAPENNQLSGKDDLEGVAEGASEENKPATALLESEITNTPVENESLVGAADEAAQAETTTEMLPQSELAIVITGDSWVEITDARGERLVYRLAKAGLSHTITGVAPFDVRLGYVPGVELFYNGAPYDLSRYAGRRSARFRVGKAGDQVTNG